MRFSAAKEVSADEKNADRRISTHIVAIKAALCVSIKYPLPKQFHKFIHPHAPRDRVAPDRHGVLRRTVCPAADGGAV
jgi:hypothetical protein